MFTMQVRSQNIYYTDDVKQCLIYKCRYKMFNKYLLSHNTIYIRAVTQYLL